MEERIFNDDELDEIFRQLVIYEDLDREIDEMEAELAVSEPIVCSERFERRMAELFASMRQAEEQDCKHEQLTQRQ
jgi:hypothetical protein